jgi:flagellar motor switch protein FliM
VPILTPQEVDALIQSTKIDNKIQDTAISKQDPNFIKPVSITSDDDASTKKESIALQFEKKYPALELVLVRFLDFLEKSLIKFFTSEVKITYQAVQEQKFKSVFSAISEEKKYFSGYYKIKPTANFLVVVFDTLFLEQLFVSKLGADVFHKYQSNEVKKKYKQMLKDFFVKIEENWNLAWRQIYPLETEFIDFLTLNDLLATPIKKKRLVQFSFALKNLGKQYSFFVGFDEAILQKLSKTKISISSFLPDKVKKRMFLEKIAKEKMKVSCFLGSYRISLQELLSLEKNDTILIDFQKGDAVFFSIADDKKFVGKFFSHKNKKAVRLIKSL